jgi:hypothetical protein
VTGGAATDLTAHGGTGAREFADLDLLLAREHHPAVATLLDSLGYWPDASASTWTRASDDPVTPLFVVDLRTPDRDGLEHAVLDRLTSIAVPGDHAPLPVLAPADALTVSLHRLTRSDGRPRWPVAADALRQHHTLPTTTDPHTTSLGAAALAGWARLRTGWPHLPTRPAGGGGP